MKKLKIKKSIFCFLICVSVIFNCFINVSATESKNDPNEEFHKMVDGKVMSIFNTGFEETSILKKENFNLCEKSKSLSEEIYQKNYTEKIQNDYNNIITSLDENNKEIKLIEIETKNEVHNELLEMGFVKCNYDSGSVEFEEENKNIKLSSDPAYMKIDLWEAYYYPSFKEVYFVTEMNYNEKWIGQYLGIEDEWNTYDILSVQAVEQSNLDGWSECTAYIYNQWDYSMGSADHNSQTTPGAIVPNTFQNPPTCITTSNVGPFGISFQVKDENKQYSPNPTTFRLRKIITTSFLKYKKKPDSVFMKTNFEHNYKTSEMTSASVSGEFLDYKTASLSVTYSKEVYSWKVTSGGRYYLPDDC